MSLIDTHNPQYNIDKVVLRVLCYYVFKSSIMEVNSIFLI